LSFYADILTGEFKKVGGRFRVRLRKRGYVGGVTNAHIAAPGPGPVYEGSQMGYRPIRGSRVEVKYFVTSKAVHDILLDATIGEREEYQIVIDERIGDNWQVYWSGFCKQDTFESEYKPGRRVVNIVATDMLANLREKEFPADVVAFNRISKIFAISLCLQQTGLNLTINTADDWYPLDVGLTPGQSVDPLVVEFDKRTYRQERTWFLREDLPTAQVPWFMRPPADSISNRFDRGRFKYTDCYKVLSDILASKQLEIKQSQGEWWILQRTELRKAQFNRRVYNFLGEFQFADLYDARAHVIPNSVVMSGYQSTEWSDTTGWTITGDGSITTTDAESSIGTHSALVALDGGATARTQLMPGVEQNDKLKVSFDLKRKEAGTAVKLYIQEHDSGGTFLAAQNHPVTITNDFGTYTHTFTISHASANQFYVGIQTDSAVSFYMDNVMAVINPRNIEFKGILGGARVLRPPRNSSASMTFYHGSLLHGGASLTQLSNLELDDWDMVDGVPVRPTGWTIQTMPIYPDNIPVTIERVPGDGSGVYAARMSASYIREIDFYPRLDFSSVLRD
jgi:hypothetical protein